MKMPRKTLCRIFLFVLTTCAIFLLINGSHLLSPNRISGNSHFPEMETRAAKALKYAAKKGLSENYCLFLDYGIQSGKPRLFVWSFSENRVVYSAYAMHGPGKGSTDETPVFSNTPGSKCSSVGRFEVTMDRGKRNKSGLRLKGLDRSNNCAYGRGIMIHGSRYVDANKWRKYIPLNAKSCQGCVTVSTRDMAYINRLVGKETEHLLLWSYYDAAA